MKDEIKTQEDLKNSYEDIYSTIGISESERHYKWIAGLINPQKGKKLLDVACGEGHLLEKVEKLGVECYGIDISEKAVSIAKINAPCSKILIGNGEDLPWENNFFDYVVCLGSIEHYLNPGKGIREISRILKVDNGIACIMVPNIYCLEDIFKALFTGEGTHSGQKIEKLATKNEWQRMFEENGLKVIKIYKYNKFTELFVKGTLKVKSLHKYFRNLFYRFSPLNLSYSFVFICKKI